MEWRYLIFGAGLLAYWLIPMGVLSLLLWFVVSFLTKRPLSMFFRSALAILFAGVVLVTLVTVIGLLT